MLLRFIALVVVCGSVGAGEDTVREQPLVISNAPEEIARTIFVGPDGEMPIDGRWRISVSPTIEDGEILVPEDLHEAFLELKRALPSWYQAALYASEGTNECFVSVNSLALHIDVMSWLWINWHLKEPDSELRATLEDMGAENRDQVLFGIHDGFCFYLKYGEERALELLALPADQWEERELPPIEGARAEDP